MHPAAQRQGGIISRTGYTGEDGFELSMGSEIALGIWEALLEAGQPLGIVPTGLGARDTLRLEAGMPLYGHELSEEIHPYQAGLGYACHLVGYDFPGRDALLKIEKQPLRLTRIGLELSERRVPRQGCPILVELAAHGRGHERNLFAHPAKTDCDGLYSSRICRTRARNSRSTFAVILPAPDRTASILQPQ